MTPPDNTPESRTTPAPDPARPIGKAARTRAANRRPPPPPPKPRPHRRRNRLILLSTATILALAAAGYGTSVLLRPPPPPPPPLAVSQPRSIGLAVTNACDILTPSEVEALVGPLLEALRDPQGFSCGYTGKNQHQVSLGFVPPQADLSDPTKPEVIDPAIWHYRIAGNSAAIGPTSQYEPDGCSAKVLLGLPPNSSYLYVGGGSGVTCDQVVAAAAAAVSHLPPAG